MADELHALLQQVAVLTATALKLAAAAGHVEGSVPAGIELVHSAGVRHGPSILDERVTYTPTEVAALAVLDGDRQPGDPPR